MRFYLFFTFVAVLFTGCISPNPESMKADDKRLIYQSVQDEIDDYKIQGDVLYSTGYYADSARAYEMVNYYEDRIVIPVEKIRSIRLRAKSDAQIHYKKGLKFSKRNKKRALMEFNKMLRNDLRYKDGQARYKALKKDPEIEPFIEKMEGELEKALAADITKIQTLKKINTAVNQLREYDDANNVIRDAQIALQKQRKILVDEAIALYNKGSLESAAGSFRRIETAYPKDQTAKKYLARIYSKKELRQTIAKAKEALKQKDFSTVIELSEKAKEFDPHNLEAFALADAAKKEYEKQIPELINKGKEFYNKQDFENSRKVFQAILLWDADDNTSLTYIKKIEEQLKTIESLN